MGLMRMVRCREVLLVAVAVAGCAAEVGGDWEGARTNPASQQVALEASNDPLAANVGTRYMVQFADPSKGAAALHAARAQVAVDVPSMNALAAYIPAAAVEGLRRNPNVIAIEEDGVRRPFSEASPYGIAMVQADQVASAVGPSAAMVCIIDSGYYAAHDDLQDTSVSYTTDSGSGDPTIDGCGHGTHVAGTIAAQGGNDLGVVGVNPGGALNLHIVKVFGNDCAWAYSSSLINALQKCRDAASAAGKKLVVSMSLGGSLKNNFEDSAFKSANTAGVLSIAAAGNDGSSRKSYPASYESVVSVAAIDSAKLKASFSQYNASVDLAAPGVGVLSTVPWVSESSVTVGGSTFAGGAMANAAQSAGATGALVDGGLCGATDAGWFGKVVLCARGTYSFYDKVLSGQGSGAVAVIISNNVSGGFSGTLGDGSTSTIPAISVSLEDGDILRTSYLEQAATVVNHVTVGASGYEAWDGTSMATPHVSGVAALVWNHFPGRTNAQLRTVLEATAEDLGTAGKDVNYGSGLVRAKAAYDRLACTTAGQETKETSCSDGADNDCDSKVDAADGDCASGGGTCSLLPTGSTCTSNSQCCSNSCKGSPSAKTCK